MPIGSWLRHTDFELGYTEVWGYWLLGNLFGGLCSWAGWISRMYFSVLYPRGSGSGCWISEWEEWVSLQSAFMVDIIVWLSSLPPWFFVWYSHPQVCWYDKPLIPGPVFSSVENKSPVGREVLAQPVCVWWWGMVGPWILTAPQTTLPQSTFLFIFSFTPNSRVSWCCHFLSFWVFCSIILGGSGKQTMNDNWLKRRKNPKSGVK